MAETKNTVFERLMNEISDDYDKSEGSYIYDAEMPCAIEFYNVYQLIELLKRQMSINTASGQYLLNLLAQYGFEPKPAVAASGYVTFSGSVGTNISIGTMVAAINITYTTTDSGTISSDGTVTLPIICTSAGLQGNVITGAINRLPIGVSGVTGVTNADAITGGSDAETENEIKQRFFEKMKHPATSGNKYFYENLAREVAGVGDAQCIPLWNGPGTAKVVITDTTHQNASQTLINSVQSYIDANKLIGADITVAAAEKITISVACTLSLSDSVDAGDIKTNIETAINEYLQDISFPETDVYIVYAKILSLIMSQDGVNDCNNLTVNSSTANIKIPVANVAVLGAIDID